MQYFAIITLALGLEQVTTTRTLNVDGSTTREAIWKHMRHEAVTSLRDDAWRGAATIFFSADPAVIG